MSRIAALDESMSLQLEFEPVSLAGVLRGLSIGFDPVGPQCDIDFTTIVPVNDLGPSALSFVERGTAAYLRHIESAPGGAVLIERKWGETNRPSLGAVQAAAFLVDRPRLAIARIMDYLRLEDEIAYYGVHPTAIVDRDAMLDPTVTIGPFCVIGRCQIGENSYVYPYTCINHNVVIGRRVRIREHCTVGGHSLGFAKDENAAWVRIKHVGGAMIDDDVQLFPYAVVDRGTFGMTKVGRGAVIGFQSLVTHNVGIGEDAMLTANVVMCGSSSVGPRTWLGVGSIVKQGVHVGADCMVGLGGVVLRDVPDGSVMAGVPARRVERGAQ